MTVRRLSVTLCTLLGLALPAASAPAGEFTNLVKSQIRKQVQAQQQQVAPQQKTFKFPNGNTGVVGPKIVTVPGNKLPVDVIVNKPGNQGINPKVGIPIVPGVVVKPGNGGIKPGVVVPKFPIVPGIVKPGVVVPKFPIDPGIGNGGGAGGGGGGAGGNNGNPIWENVVQQVIDNVLNGHGGGNCNPGGGNNGGGGGFPGNGNGGQGFPSGNGNPQFAMIDLQLHDVKLVDLGDETMGPAYRITLRNNSTRSATTPFIALLLASQKPQPTADSPYATAQVPALAAGQLTTIDVRLPQVVSASPETFGFLTAAVGTPAGMFETDDSNNRAAFDRTAVQEIPAKIMAVRVDEAAGRMILEGEGFGSKFGKLYLTVGGQNFEADVTHWGPAAVYFTIDDYTGGNATTGSFMLVRNDGRLAPPLDVALAN